VGLVALTSGFAVLAGLCAFFIDYEEGSRRFPRARARKRALTTAVVAASFFALLGLLLVLALLH
jgi:hypothetical protein